MEFKEIRKKFIEHLGDGELLFAYHCKVACFFMDTLQLNHERSNYLAHEFIEMIFEPLKYDYIKLMNNDLNCRQPEKEEEIETKEQVDNKNSKLIMLLAIRKLNECMRILDLDIEDLIEIERNK